MAQTSGGNLSIMTNVTTLHTQWGWGETKSTDTTNLHFFLLFTKKIKAINHGEAVWACISMVCGDWLMSTDIKL